MHKSVTYIYGLFIVAVVASFAFVSNPFLTYGPLSFVIILYFAYRSRQRRSEEIYIYVLSFSYPLIITAAIIFSMTYDNLSYSAEFVFTIYYIFCITSIILFVYFTRKVRVLGMSKDLTSRKQIVGQVLVCSPFFISPILIFYLTGGSLPGEVNQNSLNSKGHLAALVLGNFTSFFSVLALSFIVNFIWPVVVFACFRNVVRFLNKELVT